MLKLRRQRYPSISPGDIDGYSFVRNDPGPTQGSIIHVFKKN